MPVNKFHFDRRLPRELVQFATVPSVRGQKLNLISLRGKQWPNGSKLHVRFLGGTVDQKAFVKQWASEWMKYANIEFIFDDSPEAEIRVAFDETLGAWSYVGKDALEIPRDNQTLNLGWLDPQGVLHEFGHALALVHEHQSPFGGIQWNKPVVYADLAGDPNNWDAATVDYNVFNTYSADILNGTVFDPKSIMLYSIPPSWTLNGFSVGENTELSAMDKAFIGSAKMYPKVGTIAPNLILQISEKIEKAATIAVAGESDNYVLEIPEAGSYIIETHGESDCFLTLYQAGSETAILATDDDSGIGRNSRIEKVLEAKSYKLSVRFYSPSKTGPYRVSIVKPIIKTLERVLVPDNAPVPFRFLSIKHDIPVPQR